MLLSYSYSVHPTRPLGVLLQAQEAPSVSCSCAHHLLRAEARGGQEPCAGRQLATDCPAAFNTATTATRPSAWLSAWHGQALPKGSQGGAVRGGALEEVLRSLGGLGTPACLAFPFYFLAGGEQLAQPRVLPLPSRTPARGPKQWLCSLLNWKLQKYELHNPFLFVS